MGAWSMPAGRPVDLPGRGTTWVYEAEGPPGAPTVLLVHGLAATAALNWFAAFGRLAERFRVVAFDLRGHGRGIRSSRRFRLSDCADDAAALADVLGLEPSIVVGYSLGGPVAQLVWYRHRDKVAGLVLAATSRNFGGTARERYFYNSLVASGSFLRFTGHVSRLGRSRTPSAPEPRYLPPDFEAGPGPDGFLSGWAFTELRRGEGKVLVQAMSSLGSFSSHTWIDRIDVPTAVVVTTQDSFISPSRQLKLARAIPGATIHPVHSNHAACVLGHRRFVPALVESCESVAARLAVADLRVVDGRARLND
jgi:pimeloyl-ACP methyl ester carboxylesterase